MNSEKFQMKLFINQIASIYIWKTVMSTSERHIVWRAKDTWGT